MFTPNYPPGDIGIIEQQIEKHYGEKEDIEDPDEDEGIYFNYHYD